MPAIQFIENGKRGFWLDILSEDFQKQISEELGEEIQTVEVKTYTDGSPTLIQVNDKEVIGHAGESLKEIVNRVLMY